MKYNKRIRKCFEFYKFILVYIVFLNLVPLIVKPQNTGPVGNITVKLEYKKLIYCDSLCDAVIIKIRNETDMDLYIQSEAMLDFYIEIYSKCNGNCGGYDWIWDYTKENTQWYRNRCFFCKKCFNDSIKTSLDYYNFFIKDKNNPNHLYIKKTQVDSILFNNLNKKMKKEFLNWKWGYSDKVLFLNKGEEFIFFHFVDYVKKSTLSNYNSNESIKIVYFFDNSCYFKLPSNIGGYNRWEKNLKSDTLMIKLE